MWFGIQIDLIIHMKKATLLCFLSCVLLTSCGSDDPVFTGNLTLIIDNQDLVNTDNLSVDVELLIDRDDNLPLRELGRQDISNGGSATFQADGLNFGNYYVKYLLILDGSAWGSDRLQPIQVTANENTLVEIDL